MAKRQQVVHFDVAHSLSTLGAQVALVKNFPFMDGATEQGAILKKLKMAVTITGKASGEGPVEFGLCDNLTAAEVQEAKIADPQFHEDISAAEEGNRHVYPLGVAGLLLTGSPALNEVAPLRQVRYPWKEIHEGGTFAVYAYNHDTSALTTGVIIRYFGVAVFEWLRD